MKKATSLIGILLISLVSIQAQELTLDEVISNYCKASGIEPLQEVSTIIITGVRITGDIMPMKIIRKRPNLYMFDFNVVDLNAFQAFDGQSAWSTAPWTGDATPKPMPESRTRDMMYQADFDGLLYNWKEKGHLLELEGIDTLSSGEAYKIKLVRADSAIEYYYIGKDDFLLHQQTTYRTLRGEQVPINNSFSDYRKVGGIPFPFLIETAFPGQTVTYEIETVELNVPVEDDVFRMPEE